MVDLISDGLTLFGALWMTWSAVAARRRIAPLKMTYDSAAELIDAMKSAAIGQARDQTVGFVLLSIGFALKLYTRLYVAA